MFRTSGATLLAAMAMVAAPSATAPASADAGSFNCDASALRATLLGQATVEPITANRGQATCQNASGTLAQTPGGLPVPLKASAAIASTQVSPDGSTAFVAGGLASLGAGLPGPVSAVLAQAATAAQGATQSAIDSVPAVTIPASSLPAPLNLGGDVTVDIRPALSALLSSIAATNADLIDLNVADAFATAKCVNGQPQLSGASQVAGLTVLGQAIPADAAVSQTLNVINTQSISPANVDISKIVLPPALSVLSPAQLQAILKPLLTALPAISVPAQLAQISVTPNQQIAANGQLTQDAIHVQVGLLGQTLIDSVLGEARVSNSSIKCAPAGQVASQLALQCTKRKLTLIDVLDRGNHVALLGAADKSLIGRHVAITFLVGHRQVAQATVGPDGFFTARAPEPPSSVRYGNLARYQASIGSERSLNLKLHRRMLVDSIRSSSGQVTIVGRVVRPLAAPVAPIYVQRRVSCTSTVNVKRIMPKSDGSFRVTLPAPPHTQAAVYRATTFVRKVTSNRKRFPTFTLPRVVQIA